MTTLVTVGVVRGSIHAAYPNAVRTLCGRRVAGRADGDVGCSRCRQMEPAAIERINHPTAGIIIDADGDVYREVASC